MSLLKRRIQPLFGCCYTAKNPPTYLLVGLLASSSLIGSHDLRIHSMPISKCTINPSKGKKENFEKNSEGAHIQIWMQLLDDDYEVGSWLSFCTYVNEYIADLNVA